MKRSEVRHYTAYGGHPVHVPSGTVLAVHQLEDAVAAALYGQMYVAGYVGARGHHIERGVGHVLGMGGGETHTHFRCRIRHHAEQCGKVCLLSAIRGGVPVRIDILAQQNNFLEAACAQVFQLGKDALRFARALAPTGIGDYAIGAEIVAPAHDADISADA